MPSAHLLPDRRGRAFRVAPTLVVLAAIAAAPAHGMADDGPARARFVVRPFVNDKGAGSLDYLEAGLPAIIAERLARHGTLRFAGGPLLLDVAGRAGPAPRQGPAHAAPPDIVIEGWFSRRPDWKLAVRVVVRQATGGGSRHAEAERVGPKDEAPRIALDAALAALSALPDMALPAATGAELAPFARDAYAFVLYGRGVAACAGTGRHAGRGGPAAGRAPSEAAAKGRQRALELLGRSLVIDPRVPETRRLLGAIHLEEGRPGHARAMWSYALDVRPDYVLALGALAALDRGAGLPGARERTQRLVELDPGDADARRALGDLLAEAGALPEAQRELEQAIALDPEDLRARRSLVLVLAARRAGTDLVAELENLVRLDGNDVEARLDLGAAYLAVGRTADAVAAYAEILRRRPRHAAALKLAADLARGQGDLKRATALLSRLRWVSPQDPRPLFLLGAAHYDAGNLDSAERYFSEAAQLPGLLGDAYSNLGAIALRRGRAREALWLLGRAVKRRPDATDVRFNYAMALSRTSRHADALNQLRVAERVGPGDAGVRFLAGVVALRLGLLHDAARSFRAAVALEPGHDDARHNVALLDGLLGAPGEATGGEPRQGE